MLRQLELRHRQALRQRDDEHAFALRFQRRTLVGQAAETQPSLTRAHERELAARSKRAATWSRKHQNMARALQRAAAARNRERERADTSEADARALDADISALQAELGVSFKVADQRQGSGARGAFSFKVIHSDLQVRARRA